MTVPSPVTTTTAVGTTDAGITMTDMTTDWRDVLSRLREVRRRDGVTEEEGAPANNDAATSEEDEVEDEFLTYLPLAAREVDGYVTALSEEDDGGGAAAAAARLVPNVRRCLRVAQSLLSPRRRHHGGGDDGPPVGVPPREAQLAAVRACLHLSLAGLLSSSSSSSEDVDTTCRTLAARTLCNLVTSNVESASAVAGDIPPSPAGRHITTDPPTSSAVIVDENAEGHNSSSWDDGDTCADEGTPRSRPGRCRRPHPHSCSWVDAIASPARRGNRDAVAAVVASIHNCLASLEDDDDGPPTPAPDGGGDDDYQDRGGAGDDEAGNDDDRRHKGGIKVLDGDGASGAELRLPEDIAGTTRPSAAELFAADVSGDRLLVCNLLRNILPVTAAAATASSSSSSSSGGVGIDEDDHADGATEWISLLLVRLVRMGNLPALYGSAGGGGGDDEDDNKKNDDDDNLVTPEQVVLLSCVARAAGEENSSGLIPIDDGPTMECLASIMSTTTGLSEESSSSSRREEERYPGEEACRTAVRWYAADVLASSLLPRDDDDVPSSSPSPSSSRERRRRLLADLGGGDGCRLIERASLQLGAAVDRVVTRSNLGRGASARRDVKVPDVEGRLIKSLVRLIGNLCHRCPENRDVLREVEVPFLLPMGPGEEPATGGCAPPRAVRNDGGDDAVGDGDRVVPSGEDGAAGKEPPAANTDESGSGRSGGRSGLHVLLSTTSLSHGCFGLREWAVVAIRDALEDNPANQGVLEELSPRSVATTTTLPPELSGLGIDLELDESGRVRVIRKGKDDG